MMRQRLERAGVLVISMHVEPGVPLIARLTAIDRLDAAQLEIAVGGDAEDVLARVREWLHAVADGEPLGW
jgi:hypothetical protein